MLPAAAPAPLPPAPRTLAAVRLCGALGSSGNAGLQNHDRHVAEAQQQARARSAQDGAAHAAELASIDLVVAARGDDIDLP